MLSKSRQCAASCIEKTMAGIPIQAVPASSSEFDKLNDLDRQFCMDLLYGYFRNLLRLDFIEMYFLKNPERLPKKLRIIIKTGIYSLLFQTKIPDYAAINESVEQVKKIFGKKFSGLANGVLRSVQRNRENLLDFDWYKKISVQKGGIWPVYSLFYSIPLNIINLWKKYYGDETVLKLIIRSSQRPWSGLRLNPGHEKFEFLYDELNLLYKKNIGSIKKIGSYGFIFAPSWLPKYIGGKSLKELCSQNIIFLQSPGSMQIMDNLNLYNWEYPVYDCCAGYGGKTLALLENGVRVKLATDSNGPRIKKLHEQCLNQGFLNCITMVGDARTGFIKKWSGNILLDAPCSGLGTMARRPDLKYGKNVVHITGEQFPVKQKELLNAMFSLLSPGRELAYITCTINPEENESLIANFAREHTNARIGKSWQTPVEDSWLEGMYGAIIKKVNR